MNRSRPFWQLSGCMVRLQMGAESSGRPSGATHDAQSPCAVETLTTP